MSRYTDPADRALAIEDRDDERAVQARKERLWEAAQRRTTADYLQPGELTRAARAGAVRRHWLSTLGDVDNPRDAAAQWLRFARESRRGVEAAGVRQIAAWTFHEAATHAARTFATAYLDGNLQPVWVGAFALLRDREERAKAMTLGRVAA